MAPVLLSREDLRARGIKYSPSQINRKIKDKSFPLPVRLSDNRVAWVEGEIDDWVNGHIADRDAKVA